MTYSGTRTNKILNYTVVHFYLLLPLKQQFVDIKLPVPCAPPAEYRDVMLPSRPITVFAVCMTLTKSYFSGRMSGYGIGYGIHMA